MFDLFNEYLKSPQTAVRIIPGRSLRRAASDIPREVSSAMSQGNPTQMTVRRLRYF